MAKNKPTPRKYVLSVKGLPEFKEWLQRYANHRKVRMIDLICQGLALLAKKDKYDPPPKR